jgi:hypothetical protein
MPPSDNPEDQRQDLGNKAEANGEYTGAYRDDDKGDQKPDNEKNKGTSGNKQTLSVIGIVHRSNLPIMRHTRDHCKVAGPRPSKHIASVRPGLNDRLTSILHHL